MWKILGFCSQSLSEGDHGKMWSSGTISCDGGALAHIDIRPRYNMSRYGVDVVIFEGLFDSQLQFDSEIDVVLVNEIGSHRALAFEMRVCDGFPV